MDSGVVGVVDIATKSVRRMKSRHNSVSPDENLSMNGDRPRLQDLRQRRVYPQSPQRTHQWGL